MAILDIMRRLTLTLSVQAPNDDPRGTDPPCPTRLKHERQVAGPFVTTARGLRLGLPSSEPNASVRSQHVTLPGAAEGRQITPAANALVRHPIAFDRERPLSLLCPRHRDPLRLWVLELAGAAP